MGYWGATWEHRRVVGVGGGWVGWGGGGLRVVTHPPVTRMEATPQQGNVSGQPVPLHNFAAIVRAVDLLWDFPTPASRPTNDSARVGQLHPDQRPTAAAAAEPREQGQTGGDLREGPFHPRGQRRPPYYGQGHAASAAPQEELQLQESASESDAHRLQGQSIRQGVNECSRVYETSAIHSNLEATETQDAQTDHSLASR